MFNDFSLQIKEALAFFQNERNKYIKELGTLPEGSLGFSNGEKRKQYFWHTKDNTTIHRYGINKRPDIIRKLARKEYLARLISELDQNIAALTRALKDYRDINPDQIIKSMARSYQQLSEEYFFSNNDTMFTTEDEEFRKRLKLHEEWAKQPYEKNTHPFGEWSQLSSRGERMRSKNELSTIERLYVFEAPHRYDQIIRSSDGRIVLAPDFTFQAADMRSEFYLEICGMMDDQDYVHRYLYKRKQYAQLGINEWTNMIYIFFSGNNIDVRAIDAAIRGQILPRL